MEENLYILNKPSQISIFQNQQGKYNIDIVVVTAGLVRTARQWMIYDQAVNSSHHLITSIVEIKKELNFMKLKL